MLISNTFFTFAWDGHLTHRSWTLCKPFFFRWLIALSSYCFQVSASRFGDGRLTGYQLKIIQQAITLVVFVAFAYFYLGEDLRWNYAVSGVCLFGAVAFAFRGRA